MQFYSFICAINSDKYIYLHAYIVNYIQYYSRYTYIILYTRLIQCVYAFPERSPVNIDCVTKCVRQQPPPGVPNSRVTPGAPHPLDSPLYTCQTWCQTQQTPPNTCVTNCRSNTNLLLTSTTPAGPLPKYATQAFCTTDCRVPGDNRGACECARGYARVGRDGTCAPAGYCSTSKEGAMQSIAIKI